MVVPRPRVAALGAFLALAGCRFPLGGCEAERVELRGQLVAELRGRTTTDGLLETFARTNDPAAYATVRQFVVDAPPASGGVVWTARAFATNGGGLAVRLTGPLRAGDRVPVTGAFDGGGWGVVTTARGPEAAVAVRAADFVARSATGTVEVLGVAPLRVRLDVTATDPAGTVMRVRGEQRFALVREDVPCT